MEIFCYKITIFIVLAVVIQEHSTKEDVENITIQLDKISNPLANLIRNENEIGDVSRNRDHTKDALSRVKRQSYYDYYPYYRQQPPIVFPIIFGGGGFNGGRGFGTRGFGGRGFGGRGFGGRGFGGRGFGGRGFGGGGFAGRGFGGRGFGGIGFGGRGFGGGRGRG